jgi:urease accessory protein
VTSTASLLHQRSRGHVRLEVGKAGLVRLREEGAAKLRLPHKDEAVLINTGGGLAGGDEFRFDIGAGPGASLTVTTQAAERVYRSLGPPAKIATALRAEAGATLCWLPQETILFDGASLNRSLEVEVADDASFLAVEAVVLGRAAMGETVKHLTLRDHWRIRRNGQLIHAEDIAISGEPPGTRATLGEAKAMATILLVWRDAETAIDRVRSLIGKAGAASAWNGKLVARLLARDGLALRKVLCPVLSALMGDAQLPKAWSL